MSTNILNFEAVRGDDFSFNFAFEDDSGPVDITDWILTLTIKSKASLTDAEAELQKVVSTHDDAVNGITTIPITHDDTLHLQGVYKYDIELQKNDGIVKTMMLGTIKFFEDMTRRI